MEILDYSLFGIILCTTRKAREDRPCLAHWLRTWWLVPEVLNLKPNCFISLAEVHFLKENKAGSFLFFLKKKREKREKTEKKLPGVKLNLWQFLEVSFFLHYMVLRSLCKMVCTSSFLSLGERILCLVRVQISNWHWWLVETFLLWLFVVGDYLFTACFLVALFTSVELAFC